MSRGFDYSIAGQYEIQTALDNHDLTDAQKLLVVLNSYNKLATSYRICHAEKDAMCLTNQKLRKKISEIKD